MLSSMVGNVDANAAWVLVIFFIMIGVIGTAFIVKRQVKESLENDFQLARMKQEGELKVALLNAEASRDINIKKLDQNLITSHSDKTPSARSDD